MSISSSRRQAASFGKPSDAEEACSSAIPNTAWEGPSLRSGPGTETNPSQDGLPRCSGGFCFDRLSTPSTSRCRPPSAQQFGPNNPSRFSWGSLLAGATGRKREGNGEQFLVIDGVQPVLKPDREAGACRCGKPVSRKATASLRGIICIWFDLTGILKVN